jgi:GPH family glycoside/pentoside/hexuronide:cation symporter
MFGAMVGVLGIQICFLPTVAFIADAFLGGERVYAYSFATVIYMVLGGIILFMLYLGCPEKVYEEQLRLDREAGISLEDRKRMAKEANNTPLRDVSYLFRNKPWVIIFCIMFLSFFAQPLQTVGLPYFYVYYLHQDETGVALFSTVTMITSFAGIFATPFLVKLFDYKIPCIVGTAVCAAGNIVAFFLGSNLTAVMASVAIANLFGSILGVAGLAMLADAIEFGDWKFDRRLEGLGTAAYSFSTKAGPALGNIMISAVLATAGLNTALTINDQQSDAALSALHFALFFLPAIVRVIQVGLLFLYPLTRDKYEKVIDELRVRNEKWAAAEAKAHERAL